MAYSVFLTKTASRELANLPEWQHNAVVKRLRGMEENPRRSGAEKLHGRGEYKLRVGNLRVIYGIDDVRKEVVIYMIDDRKQVYRRLKRR